MAPPYPLDRTNFPSSPYLSWKHPPYLVFHPLHYWIPWNGCHFSNTSEPGLLHKSTGRSPRKSCGYTPHLKEIGIIVDGQLLAPLTNPVLLALRLPSARRVKTRLVAAFNIPPTPILPLSFKGRLPGLGATPEVSVTIDREFNIEFFGLGQSKLTLSIFSITGVLLTRTIFGDAPFGSVRKLQVCFPGPVTNLAPFVTILRATRGLEWLEMEQSIEEPLTHWAEADDQAEICPALTTLIVDITEVDADEAKDYVRWLEQARGCAGVPIACVGIGYRQD